MSSLLLSFDCCHSTSLTVKKIILIIISFPLKVKAAAKYVDVPVSIFYLLFKTTYNSFFKKKNNYSSLEVDFKFLNQCYSLREQFIFRKG